MAELQPNQQPKLSDTERVRQAVEGKSPDESQGDDAANGDDNDEDADDDAANGDDAGDDSADDSADDDADGDDADADDDADGEDDDSKPNDQPKDRRFTQFAGDGKDETYISNLEKGYENSSKEAIRLNQELSQATGRVEAIMRAAATDPDLAAKLNAAVNGSDAGGSGDDKNSNGSPADNPFVRNLQSEWQEKSEKEIAAFIEANPEVATDPQISADVKHWMNVFSNDAYNRTGRLMSGGEAMALAYKHLGLDNKLEKQNLADGAKKIAGTTRPRGKAKRSTGSKPTFTPDQIAMAQAMGKDEAWLVANAK